MGEMGSWPPQHPQDWRGAPHSTHTPRGSRMPTPRSAPTAVMGGWVRDQPRLGRHCLLGGGTGSTPPPRGSEPFPGPTRFNRVNFVICCPYPLHGQATTATPPYPQPRPPGGPVPLSGWGHQAGTDPPGSLGCSGCSSSTTAPGLCPQHCPPSPARPDPPSRAAAAGGALSSLLRPGSSLHPWHPPTTPPVAGRLLNKCHVQFVRGFVSRDFGGGKPAWGGRDRTCVSPPIPAVANTNLFCRRLLTGSFCNELGFFSFFS